MNAETTDLRTQLAKQIGRRQVNRVLHGHPGTALWDLDDVDVAAVVRDRPVPRKPLNVYVGTPYCMPTDPDRCGFCLFPSEEYRGGTQLADYLQHLRRELALHQGSFDGEAPSAVYFGGGTSNLYRPAQLTELLEVVRTLFPDLGGAEVTLEGIPQTFSREKLEAAKNAGVNRVSVGVQQFEDHLIAFSGRKQRKEHVLRVLSWCKELGLRTSIDLIYGWPTQTLEDLVRDLETAVSFGVTHLTHYELNVGGRTDFATRHADTLPSVEATLEMYRVARDFLTARGYRQVTTYDWEREHGALRFEDASRAALSAGATDAPFGVDTLGLGFAALSCFPGTPDAPGWTYVNHTTTASLTAAVAAGRFPVASGYRYTSRDLELTLLYQALLGKHISRPRYAQFFGGDVVERYAPLWDVLLERGWLEITPESLTLVGDGVFFTPTLQELLSRPRVRELQAARVRARARTVA